MTFACALVLLTGPALAGSAYAAPPGPDTSPSASPGAGGTDGVGGGTDAGGGQSLEQIRKRIERLHARAAAATDKYNAAEAKASKQKKSVGALNRAIDANEKKLNSLRKRAGALARAQYRGGGMPDAARVVLAQSPAEYLRRADLARNGQQATRAFLDKLRRTDRKLSEHRADAASEWEKLEGNRKRKARAKQSIERQLNKAEKLRSRLAADERRRLAALEERAARDRQAEWTSTGILDEVGDKASKAGERALAYATKQLGKDYEWGAEGPGTFDCSGLTMRAWQTAGESLPRTSQQQWKQLTRVPAERMRPGDLIIYRQNASHVGIYVGDGKIVHAPRTGRQITVAGAGSMPILGVVRPDA
ncbi:C40 family peptidase [Streptomyces oceani]|uniref:Glycoside hydrolase n=1 Tax=Streptomyces oceani TaxID=1075402 RepID=A0A1E7KQ41_9ACTN|nr:C40 family peptidase [Streptomyces oceani]OEV06055.1 glycoside hydrolase [Streptomyces oceani]